jgi:hypothetical protein
MEITQDEYDEIVDQIAEQEGISALGDEPTPVPSSPQAITSFARSRSFRRSNGAGVPDQLSN